MGLSTATGTITTPTSTGNVATTGLGFQPKLLLVFGVLSTASGFYHQAIGAGTSSSSRWSQSLNQGAGQDASRLMRSNKIFTFAYSGAASGVVTTFVEADLVSLDADGFTLNWTTVDASAWTMYWCAIGGTDVSAAVGIQTTGTGTGNESITGLSFTPKVAMMYGFETPVNLNSGSTNSTAAGISAALSSSSRWAWAGNSDSALTAASVLATDKFWKLILSSSGAVFMEADFVSMDAAGFTYNISTGSIALDIPYIALGGTARYAVGTFGTPTSTGNQSITGVGFTPSVDLFVSAGRVASNSASAELRYTYGVGVDSTHNRQTNGNVAYGTTDQVRGQDVLAFGMVNATGTALFAATINSQDADGFTNAYAVATATVFSVGYLAIGAAPPAARYLLVRN